MRPFPLGWYLMTVCFDFIDSRFFTLAHTALITAVPPTSFPDACPNILNLRYLVDVHILSDFTVRCHICCSLSIRDNL